MRVIASSTLHGYVRNCVAPSQRKAIDMHLRAWLSVIERATWKNSAELKAAFRSASIINAERVVFNIKGNDYRLITAVDYRFQILLVKWLGTHKEYDQIDVQQATYDKERYANPSDS